ncbi:YrvL family regulatory protein [Mesobacillus maritimus]|uniref:Regulatory protein YrvL n=1 Tax=Mesobacillus maritimus TaxID=1643336 RepID=A0ABS7K6F6_9BACI|nr:YrvL family regulatory protein [Mesobacillus maritimus]MBY0097784.1 hypothetical protein [Mesobacillus maritimus]
MSNDNSSFRDMNFKDKVLAVTTILFLIVFSISFVLGIAYFGFAGIFSLLGVNYNSFYSLLIFVASYYLVGIITDIFSKAIVRVSSQFISGKWNLLFARMMIDCTVTWLLIFTIDEIMHSITIPFPIEILLAVLLFIIGVALEDKKD